MNNEIIIVDSLHKFDELISQDDIFNNVQFNLIGKELRIHYFKSIYVEFNNCIFNCNQLSILNIKKSELIIEFNNCIFNSDFYLENCEIDQLRFFNTKKIKSLKLFNHNSVKSKIEINHFSFKNELNNYVCEEPIVFSFHNVFFKRYFELVNINNINGIISFSNNLFGDEMYEKSSSCVFHSSILSNINFSNNEFNTFTSFRNSTFSFNKNNFIETGSIWHESKFYNNQFRKVDFNEVEFDGFVIFEKCDFLSTTWFENCKNLKNSHLKFDACEFKGFSLFNDSKLNFLDIDRCTFDKSSSFTDSEFNKLKLYEVKFGGGAYFDEMKIKG